MNIGVQIYTIRSIAEQDLIGCLHDVRAMGYDGVEFAGLYGTPVEEVRQALDETQLAVYGAHIRLDELRGDLQSVVSDYASLNCEYAIIPWLDVFQRTEEELHKLFADIPRFAETFRAAGIRFAYHNHDFEFVKKASGKRIWDQILAFTDPDDLAIEFDPYWCFVGGGNPTEELAAVSERLALLQLKDASLTDPIIDVPAGQGRLDWTSLVSTARQAGVTRLIIEQDFPQSPDPLDDIRAALKFARTLDANA